MILPMAIETRITWTANLRAIRHFLKLRGGVGADLEIRRLALKIYEVMQEKLPVIVEDMSTSEILNGEEQGMPFIKCE